MTTSFPRDDASDAASATPSAVDSDDWRASSRTARILELSSEILGTATLDGYLSSLNRSGELTLGWTTAALKAVPFMTLVHPDDVALTTNELERLHGPAPTRIVQFENRFRTGSHEYRRFRWTVSEADGELCFAGRETTNMGRREGERAEALARAAVVDIALATGRGSTSLLAAIVDSSVDGVIGMSPEGIITSWNLGAERMFGYDASEVIGRRVSLLHLPGAPDEVDAALPRIARGGLSEQHDLRRVRKDGTELDVSVTIAPIRNENGTIIGAVAVDRDITHRLALERERRALDTRLNQSERLESLGRLAGGIAHDFNNLLSVILSYANFIGEELDDHIAATSDLKQVIAAADRASGLTRQLLAFARREVLQPKVLSLNDVISDLEPLLRRTLGEHVELRIEPSAELARTEADPGQLEQVLVNLVVNARDAMPHGGTITIQTVNVDVDGANAATHPSLAEGRYVGLIVSDTGSGIEASALEHVFEPFFTTKAHGEGTGLGLPMVFGILSQAGGDIQLYSEVGVGTTCRVLLPATERLFDLDETVQAPLDLRGTERILVVEDEEALREVIRRILLRSGYEVQTGASGDDAMAIFQAAPESFALLVTDVTMPKMVGTELASRLRAIRPDLLVLFISGYAQPVLGSTIGDGTELLEKPFSEHELLTRVRCVLDDNC
jgi:hypothetical protein